MDREYVIEHHACKLRLTLYSSQLAGLPSPKGGRGAVAGRPNADDSDEEFVYPGGENSASPGDQVLAAQPEVATPQEVDADEEEFVYPAAGTPASPVEGSLSDSTRLGEHPIPALSVSTPVQSHPTPAQLEALYAAASSGDLQLFRNLFRNTLENGNLEPFTLANDATSRTGLNPLHAAASRGYLDIVKWLVEECGAMPDLEDKEGEVRFMLFPPDQSALLCTRQRCIKLP
jgi:hypothetical protein